MSEAEYTCDEGEAQYQEDHRDQWDYLSSAPSQPVLQNLSKMGEHLKALKLKVVETEAAYTIAKKEYEYYASSVLPMEMFNAGVAEVRLMSGGVMKYERKFYCQPNKNEQDRKEIITWLNEHGGDYLIKRKAEVPGAMIDKLKADGIPYAEVDDINTNSLKAFLKDKVGASGGQAQIQVTDIPTCIHFQEVGIVDITT